ncbi:selenoneine biosynthesis selenosugar synthase SenB [Noviherbaspirillum suwonense]|uniref:Glycosyltransferase, TIGR04348 family n=1 Tax=Noviherbaspirillum suwonense TaxID=1224511 RepID=A0ABY1QNV4_9BURK|nr:selenoneine biosynthesis selenosugar synthase SenB [Noviherbaspirillum suwonense]SMP75868.1 putative glycosyltransferase, TIGR04348 family [Noviherbaspirillum suwonense]
MLNKPRILVASPASSASNNGNWQTAYRWGQFLGARYHVGITKQWDRASPAPDALIALHARRSADSIAAYAQTGRPLVVVLTGTDLYRDIRHDDDARRSLQLAHTLVVLQDAGLDELPAALLPKTVVIYQSAPPLPPLPAGDGVFDVMMVGHLRAEKDPLTFMRAAMQARAPGLRFTQVGGALDDSLGRQAEDTAARCPAYRWLGALAHDAARALLRGSRLLAVPSLMEGGANVIAEALASGVPVLASDISGNRGMLGADYAGYFPAGDAAALARLAERAATDPAFEQRLRAQCAARLPLFAPERERAAVLRLMDNALTQHRTTP